MNRPDDEIQKGSINEQKIEIEENCERTNFEQFMGVRFCTPFLGSPPPSGRTYISLNGLYLKSLTELVVFSFF